MNRTEFRAILTLLTVLVLLLGSSLAATGSPPTMPISTSPPAGQGPYLYLTNYTFDPLLEATPSSLPTNLKLSSYPTSDPGYYLLQFQGPIQSTWKEAIITAGAQIYDYIPDFAFVVKMDQTAKAAVEALDAVRWVGLYQPGYRVAPQLMYTPLAADAGKTVDVTVVVFKGENMAALTEQLQVLGGTILDVTETHWKGKIRVQLARSQIDAVAHLSGVKWIEPSPEWKLLNDEAADIMGVRDVWNVHGLHGAGQTVAVCDTGLDQGSTSPASLHDDFEDGSGSSRVTAIYDLVGGGDGASDVNSGHGTHVAGSVLGNGDQSGSTPSSHTYPSSAYVGMAPEASLVFQAVEQNSTGYLTGIPADLNTLFQQAYDDAARIHTNSWGSAVAGTYTSSSEEVDEFVWDHKNFTVLFAAGNEGIDNNADGVVDRYSMDSPGTAKNCITVGATENNRPSFSDTWGTGWPDEFSANPVNSDRIADDTSGMAAFSSRGPALDGRIKPDVVAPGTYVASTKSSATSATGWGPINSYYTYMGGTSMATPLTAGAAALVRDYYTDNEGITPSAALIKATLINGATDIYPGQYGTGATQEITPTRPSNVAGWGRVNVENALFPTSPRAWVYYDEATGLNTSNSKTYTLTVASSSEPLKVTLAWSDYPGSPAAAGGLVNDLDLSLTAPGGTVYYPNNASQRGATQYLQYDSSPWNVGSSSAGHGVAVKFTPTSYPVQLDKALFYVYASSYPATFTCNVWDDDGTGEEPGTNLFSTSVTARAEGWLAVDISGVNITSGSFYAEMRFAGTEPRIVLDNDGRTPNVNWYYNGSTWSESTESNDYDIRAVMVSSDHSTSFDRVNNIVGVDLTSPATGVYTVTVHAENVPQGPQPYALVASGAISATMESTYPIYLPIVLKGHPSLPDLLTSEADACVLQGYPTTNLGSTTDMWAGYDDYLDPDGQIVRSLIKFDVSSVPAGASINSVTLRVYKWNSWDYPGRSRTITAYRISSNWSESTVTWNSRPSYAEAYGSASVSHDGTGWYSFDVTNLVKAWANGTYPNYGVMLRGPEYSGSDSSWKAFYTRETSYDPELVFAYTTTSLSVRETQLPEIEADSATSPTILCLLDVSADQGVAPMDSNKTLFSHSH